MSTLPFDRRDHSATRLYMVKRRECLHVADVEE